jgi:glyoxylate reductase
MKLLVSYQLPKEGLSEIFKKFEVIYPENKEFFSESELIELAKDVDAIISVFLQKIDNKVIENAKKLKIISNYGVGYNNIDIEFAAKRNIAVTNTPDVVTEPTADMAFGLILSVMRRIDECSRKLRENENFEWGLMKNLGTSLYGKTLGIVGMGNIGKALARRALASGMKIIYHNRKKLPEKEEIQYSAKYVSFDELIKNSDVLSLNCPLTSETKHLINAEVFSEMKNTAFLINTARGAVVNEADLINALKNKEIAGAGLDVFEFEPQISKALFQLDNVVMTPHTATGTHETRFELAQMAAQNILDYFEGKKIRYKVN